MMAVDDESFYNILGEEVSRGNLVQQMVNYYGLKYEVGETKVTDFNEGSEIRNLLEAVAVDHYIILEDQNENGKIAFIDTATGEWLDKHGLNPFIKIERDTGQEATGMVTFTLDDVSSEDIVIPEATILINDDGLEYATDSECIIPVGETESDCFATCLTVGEDGNCGSNSITVIDDDYIDVDGLSVSNNDAFAGGTDYEEDEEYRERLLSYVRKNDFGSLPYYIELGNNVEGVHDVLLVDNNVYTKKILVNGDVKPTPNDVLVDVLTEFTKTEKIVVTHRFTVDVPTYVIVNLTVDLDVAVELDETMLTQVINAYFDGGTTDFIMEFEGLNIGQSVTKSELQDVFYVIDNVNGVTVSDSDTGEKISELTVASTEVLRLGTVTFNQTIVD